MAGGGEGEGGGVASVSVRHLTTAGGSNGASVYW